MPRVVLVHGFTQTGRSWAAIAARLSAVGHDVVCPDAAGVGDRLRNTAAGLADSLRRCGTGQQTPLWSRLAELRMPVLCLAGERDERFTALARRMADTIGPNAAAEVIAGAGHAAHLEAPDAFADRLVRFVDEHGS